MPSLSNILVLAALALGALAPPARAQAPTHTLEPPDNGASRLFGIEVAAVPDSDGDGLADLLVGAYSTSVNGVTRVGQAHLYSGATGALLRTLDSPNPRQDGLFGFSVAGVPDADGDGRGDLVIGAVHELVVGINPGRAYLFSGATGALLRSLTSPNGTLLGEFGHAVSGIADVNGDGRGDLLVGANRENVGNASQSGRAYVFSGATGTLLHTLTRPTAQANAYFGAAVAGVPDADGDAVGDLLVGAFWNSGAFSRMGAAYLFSGASGAHLHTLTSPNPEQNGYLGYSVAGLTDVNGDGRGDLLVSAQAEDGGAPGAGRAYVFSGSDGALLRTLLSPTPENSGIFSESVSGIPDVDGDGVGDLLIGAALENGGLSDAGRIHVFSGASGAHLGSLQSPNPRTVEQLGNFGDAVAGVPDVNGDGRGDLLIGAPRETIGTEPSGRTYLFSGDAIATDAAPAPAGAAFALRATPNPARVATMLAFTLDQPGPVRLTLYDALGREVAVLLDGVHRAGPHEAALDASALRPGLYLARLEADGRAVTRRVTVAR